MNRQGASRRKRSSAAQPSPTPVVERVATVATDLLNIRSDPSTSGSIQDTAATGAVFTVVGESDDGTWLQLAKDGTTIGWAAAEFLTVEERTVQAPAGTRRRPGRRQHRRQPGRGSTVDGSCSACRQ